MTNTQWPINELLPHQGEMILIDEVLHFDEESVSTRLRVRANTLLSRPDGGLPASCGLELMAQSVAALAGCLARQAGKAVGVGFLLGTRNYHCVQEAFSPEQQLRIDCVRTLDGGMGMNVFECKIFDESAPGSLEPLAEARLNVFKPEHPETFIKETVS